MPVQILPFESFDHPGQIGPPRSVCPCRGTRAANYDSVTTLLNGANVCL